MSEDNSWGTTELAEASGLSAAHIRRLLIDDQELHGYKLGRDWRVSDIEARQWLEERGIDIEK